MARKRMLSEEILYDEQFNGLSLEAQNLFIRMLSKTDDCGVVPADPYPLQTLLNPPEKVRKNIEKFLQEIVATGLGKLISYEGKRFFLFKQRAFDNHQRYILGKRTRSEYLKLSYDDFVSQSFSEVPASSERVVDPIVISKESTVESKEQKAKRSYAENVKMTEDEFSSLVSRLKSEKRANRCVEILDNYKGSKGKTYKSDYKAVLSWVIAKLEDEEAKNVTRSPMLKDPAPRMRRCEKCGKEFPSGLILCPKCYPTTSTRPPTEVLDIISSLEAKMDVKE